MKKLQYLFWGLCFILSHTFAKAQVSHQLWDNLLKKHVDDKGMVDYGGIKADSLVFNTYLEILKTNHPNEKKWSKEAQMAYWINAYNAFTVKLIIDNYPLKSIKDIKKGIPFVNTVWDIKFIKIGKNTYDLNNIEHSKLRKKFNDPRIHFAINCASLSCPNLSNKAYFPENLSKQLDEAAKNFINDTSKNIIQKNKVQLSKIFSWYQGDFMQNRTLFDFLNKYSITKIDNNASIDYLDYSWNLNGK
ncbi:MAG: DUF547 domain-containing protein [Saprospiraceae bacterium]|nr:DUF547 domain-containing protein [Saprospiraceae bacterium]